MTGAKWSSSPERPGRTVLSRGRHLCLMLVLASFLVTSSMAAGFEDMSLFGLMNTCRFRRSLYRNICCGDFHCPSHSCCELYFIYGGFSAQGKCVRRDPVTSLCSRRRSCRRQSDCGTGECCRLEWQGDSRGVCDSYGRHGHVCTVKPVFVKNLPVVCPCDVGHACKGFTYMDVQGTCLSTMPPTTTSTTTTTTKPTTTTLTTTTRATTTTTVETTTIWQPCSQCTDLERFCCLNDQCRIRPVLGEECGAATCPCQANTSCSFPTSPDHTGQCLSTLPPTTPPPTTTLPPTTSTTTATTTVSTSSSTTTPATTSTSTPPPTTTTTQTTEAETTTTEMPTTTPTSTTTSASTTITSETPTTTTTPTPTTTTAEPTTTTMPPTTSTPQDDSTTTTTAATTTPEDPTTTTAEPTTTTMPPTTSTPQDDSTTTTTAATTTPEDPCARCRQQDQNYFCCLNGVCRIRPTLNQECGSNTCPCQGDLTCSVPLSPDSKGTCTEPDSSNLVNQ